MSRWAAVLAGGSGTRFWPLSTAARPKQLLTLSGSEPLLVAAVRRLGGLVPPERVLILTSTALCDRVRTLLPEVPPEHVLAEPRAASTAPALTWATWLAYQQDPDASLLSLHADWHVGDPEAFRKTGARALDVAERHDVLVTVGIVPTRPEVGYGYIQPGEPLEDDARQVERFVEKPDLAGARRLIERGALWNSGLFAWRCDRFLVETREVAREIAAALPHLERGDVVEFFVKVTPIAVDVSHFERSRRVAVLPGRFAWDDVGTWAALARVRETDDAGNVLVGNALQHESRDCVVWAEDNTVVVDGVDNLVVVHANGVTLVTTRDRAMHLKELLATLPPSLRNLTS